MNQFAQLLEFEAANGLLTRCDVHRLELNDGVDGRLGRVLVIVSDRPDNEGQSITNAAELIATLLCDSLEIAPARLVYVEHYPAPLDTYDLVTFKLAPGRGPGPQWPDRPSHFRAPTFWRMERVDWRELGLDDPRELARDAGLDEEGGPH